MVATLEKTMSEKLTPSVTEGLYLDDGTLGGWAKHIARNEAELAQLRARVEQLESITLGIGRPWKPNCGGTKGTDSFTISTDLMETRVTRLQEQITQNHKRLEALETKNLPPNVRVSLPRGLRGPLVVHQDTAPSTPTVPTSDKTIKAPETDPGPYFRTLTTKERQQLADQFPPGTKLTDPDDP